MYYKCKSVKGSLFMMGVEKIGHFDVRKIGDNKYSVACNNGNIGACITDEAGVLLHFYRGWDNSVTEEQKTA